MMDFVYLYQAWLIFGIILVVLDIWIGLGFFSLSFGVAAMITGAALTDSARSFLGSDFLAGGWHEVVVLYAALCIVCVIPIRILAHRTTPTEDINKY